MNLTITKDQIIAGLQAVQNVVSTRTTLPILSNVLLRAEGGHVEFTATDLDVTISSSANATVSEPGRATLPVKKLFGIARELPAPEIEIEIDEKAVTLLATHQPVAGDLRLILMASRISGELERIGDLVINITENVATLVSQPQLKPLIDIPRMAEVASKMVHESLDSFLRSDVLLAQAVIMTDDRVDDLKEQILRELLTYMAADPKSIERAMALILISRHLERIADHATNIAEDVIFLIQGRDVRHPKTR